MQQLHYIQLTVTTTNRYYTQNNNKEQKNTEKQQKRTINKQIDNKATQKNSKIHLTTIERN